jgi:hypothetical protein
MLLSMPTQSTFYPLCRCLSHGRLVNEGWKLIIIFLWLEVLTAATMKMAVSWHYNPEDSHLNNLLANKSTLCLQYVSWKYPRLTKEILKWKGTKTDTFFGSHHDGHDCFKCKAVTEIPEVSSSAVRWQNFAPLGIIYTLITIKHALSLIKCMYRARNMILENK